MTTLNIPERVITAFADRGNYQATIQDKDGKSLPNPLTKAEFGKQHLIDKLKQMTKSVELDNIASVDKKTAFDGYEEPDIS